MDETVPYDALDPNIRELVRVLDERFDLAPFSSCGGHANPTGDQTPEGTWWVGLRPPRTDDAWYAMECLAWIVWRYPDEIDLGVLSAHEPPEPTPDNPGATVFIVLHGKGITPEEFAKTLLDATGAE